MFNHNQLNQVEKLIAARFFNIRSFFDNYINENNLEKHTCPGCGYPTLSERGSYEICSICNWEDDNQDDDDADSIWGGPNGKLSLTQNRITIGKVLNGNSEWMSPDKAYAEKILKTISHFEQKQKEIGRKMTGDETLQHPLFEAWRQIEKELQSEIQRINKSA